MTLQLTRAAQLSAQKIKKEPALVAVFDGIDEVFGSATLYRYIRIGDDDLVIGDSWKIGGRVEVGQQIDSISFDQGTTTKIDYKLNPDMGIGESVSSVVLRLVDTGARDILNVLGQNEFLGRKCRILLSPDSTDTTFPDDYITLFRGIVDDVSLSPGIVTFNISHPDTKKRQTIFTSSEGETAEEVTDSQTTIELDDASTLINRITGPDGNIDTAFKSYVRIDDEIIEFTGVSGGNTLTGCVRGSLGTTQAAHELGTEFKSFYRLTGNAIDLALKVMLSGWGGYFKKNVGVSSVNFDNTEPLPGAIYFDRINVFEEYGLTAGDYITLSGSANNITLSEITDVVVQSYGSYVVVADSLTDEATSDAVASFRSKYDTLGDGLRMSPDEVDVTQHERLRDLFLSGASYDFYIKDTIESGKDFISNEIYKPIACYAVPRSARASMAYTVGPLPTDVIPTLNTSNVLDANKIVKKRSIGRNFYNTIIYKYDESAVEEDFLRGYIAIDANSKTLIPVGTKAFIVESKGLRSNNIAAIASTRRLNRYKFAADYIPQITLDFRTGFNIEVADLIILDGVSLQIADSISGSATTSARFYEVISKSIDIKTGRVTLSLTNTSYLIEERYGLISPASRIKTGLSSTSFIIESSFSSTYGADEYLKWQNLTAPSVIVRNDDYSVSASAHIDLLSGNTVTLDASLGFTPSAGMLMELADYTVATDQIKLIYTHITNGSADFADGGGPYVMI